MATKKSASKTPPSKRWSAKVTSDSTHPTPGIFNASAQAIADDLAKPSVSPKGPGQGMQMLSFYENRAGKNLSTERKETLEAAKVILREKEGKPPAKKSTAKKPSTKKSSAAKKSTAKKARS
jgi:tRNA(adenine34) deaminase